MKYLYWVCALVAFAFLFPLTAFASTTVLPVFGGGTGISTTPSYGQVLVGNAGGTYTPTATSSLGISGGGGGISWPWTQLTNWSTSTDATTTAQTAPAFFASSTKANQFPYASSTAFSISGSSWLGTILTGVWNGTAIGSTYGGTGQNSSAWSALPIVSSGSWSQYGGSNCSSHQYASSVNGSGVLSCSAITLTTDVSGTLPVGNGGTGAAAFTSQQPVAYNGTQLVSSSTPGGYISSHAFVLPVATGTVITASTTSGVLPIPYNMTVTGIRCPVQPAGATLEIEWQYTNLSSSAATPFYYSASSTGGLENITSNNTPTAGATTTITVGAPSGSPLSVACTVQGTSQGI